MRFNLSSSLEAARSVINAIRIFVASLVIGFFTYMIIAVLAQVAGRYIFGFSIDWAAETAILSQIWMIFFAAGLAMRENLHVSVDALVNIVSVAVLRKLTIVVAVLCLWFIWQAIVGSVALVIAGQMQSSPVLRIPMWIAYLCLPTGLAYFGLELTLSLVEKWKEPRGGVIKSRSSIS